MKIVLSFWSKPARNFGGIKYNNCRWHNPLLHCCGWIISTMLAKEKYSKVELVTDTEGLEVFEKHFKLPFDNISTALNDIEDVYSALWMTGKLKAYSIQKEPFIHIDSDVFLWKKFSDIFLQSDILAQHMENETNTMFHDVYPKYLNLMRENNITVGPYLDICENAYNAGIFGGNNIDQINKYANAALNVVYNNINKWEALHYKIGGLSFCNATIEQMLLYNMSVKENFNVSTLFPPIFHEIDAVEKGYTHLMHSKVDDTKKETEELRNKIYNMTEKKYNEYYKNVKNWLLS